jgi:hypothetical protein
MAWSFYDQNGKVLQGVLAVSIGTTELATDAVTTVKITDANVTTAKILDANVTLAKVASQAANTVLVRDASSSGVVSAKAVADTQVLIGDGTGFTAAALSSDVTMTNAGAVTIAANAVTTAKIANDQVTGAKLNPALVVGDIIYADGTDTITRLAKPGTPAGEVLTFAASATAPSWVAASAGVGLGLVIALG